jgi:hypothetical protein
LVDSRTDSSSSTIEIIGVFDNPIFPGFGKRNACGAGGLALGFWFY